MSSELKHLGCWSCHHYRPERCDIGRQQDWEADAGTRCAAFDYEPGSDEAERGEDD